MLRVLREEIDPLGIRRLEFAPARERAGRLAACIAAEQDLIDRARCRRRDGAAYGHRGRAFALGYIQGLIEMMELDDRQPEGAR